MTLRIQDLHTFFIVARAEAMKNAANELGVSAGAISQRIRSIEEKCAKRLFNRSRSGLTLTPAGEMLWRDVETSFQALEDASSRHFDSVASNRIRISIGASFATSMLVPRLGIFSKLHPHIEIAIETDDRLVDLRREPIDLAVRHGLGSYPGLRSEWIVAPKMIVVAAPSLIGGSTPIKTPEDCLGFPLLQEQTQRDWSLWFQAHGTESSTARFGPTFSDAYLLVRAAVSGQGLALINDLYACDELDSGSLVRVLDTQWPTQFAYYAVGLPAVLDRPAVRKFVTWMKANF